jgi:hypothetical protein
MTYNKWKFLAILLLLQSALQPLVGFGLLNFLLYCVLNINFNPYPANVENMVTS